jgi:hypothetical protein
MDIPKTRHRFGPIGLVAIGFSLDPSYFFAVGYQARALPAGNNLAFELTKARLKG